jgi:hypothetical protein
VGKRSRNRKSVETTDYVDDDGNVLTLRHTTSKVPDAHVGAASSVDDQWHRQAEIRFERYAVRWVIAGLPIEKQKELLGRYRMADRATQAWVQHTIDRHIDSA